MVVISAALRQLRKLGLEFVPPSRAPVAGDIDRLQHFLNDSTKLLILTGAGLSTESGIPDYRSEGVGLYERTDRRPMNYQDFVKSARNRQRYWARNYVGWPQFANFQPNESHVTLAAWQRTTDKIQLLVTQNVDALHSKAGSENVVELHGCSHRVVCLSCDSVMDRWTLQSAFKRLNPSFQEDSVDIAPDGDVLLSEAQEQGFTVPPCPSCGGILKPDVVFFGDNVPRAKVEHVFSQVEQSDAMLIAGSSLQVYSAYRFVRRAHERNKPIALINIGATRADKLVDVKVSARCGEVLPLLKAA